MSFWKNNPCCPTWSDTLSSWWGSNPPRLLQPGRIQFPLTPISGILLREAMLKDSHAISEFWNRYFSVSEKCRTLVPPSHIETCVKEGVWQIFIAIEQRSGNIVATGVRRLIHKLHIGPAFFEKAAMIDYFCVHPAWRKRGVGRLVLNTLQNTGSTPLPPHLILWEGLHPSIPPLSVGLYWVKERLGRAKPGIQTLPAPTSWPPPGSWIWSEFVNPLEVKVWKTTSGITISWNTFHRRIPDGSEIGVVLWSSTDTSLEEFVEQGPFGVVLTPYKPGGSGWTIDSPWQLIGYNLSYSPGATFPSLCL